MKKIFILTGFCMIAVTLTAQNVGIGNSAPAEKLDVTGNINLTGQLKTNGNAGISNQVLMKDAANLPVWTNLADYKNFASFVCTNIAASTGGGNCITSWTVPANVTEVLVEAWGGGGGGSTLTAGGGGAYIAALMAVTPGGSVSITVGAGGLYGSSSTNGIAGGSTVVVANGFLVQGTGGSGGRYGDPGGTSNTNILQGAIPATNLADYRYIPIAGQPGLGCTLTYEQASATDFAKVIHYGSGGDGGNAPNSGGVGGYRFIGATINQIVNSTDAANDFSGGGACDPIGGEVGRGGKVIIHWN